MRGSVCEMSGGNTGGSLRVDDRLILLAERLRRAHVPVSTTELVDAFETTKALGIGDRSLWRNGLRAAMVKRADQLPIFDDLFDRTFPLTSRFAVDVAGVATDNDQPSAEPSASASDTSDTNSANSANSRGSSLGDRLLDAVARGDATDLRALAAEAVDAFAALQRGGSNEKQYMDRVVRAVELGALLQRAIREARQRADTDGLSATLAVSEATQSVSEFRALLAREIAMRLAMLQPVETITTVKYPDDVEFLETTIAQRAELRRAIDPLARKLAARMAQRRRLRRTGKVDVRRTSRKSLAYGGVPVEPAFRAKRASRPDLVVLCDVSGSVADFAHFILSLVHALHEELHRLRTYVFVDGIAEVTSVFAEAQHDLAPMHLVAQPGVVKGSGHSDYGLVLDEFLKDHAAALRPTTTIIITGDARSNYRDARSETLRRISERVRAVYWLNPEPGGSWDSRDSVIGQYKPHCTGVFEVRTTRQLVAAVLEIDSASR
jgi:uncharacterized protein